MKSEKIRYRKHPLHCVQNDFDGDGVSDKVAYYSPLGKWYIYSSTKGAYENQFGYAGTIPITGDFDGDGKSDFGCYYPPDGNWYYNYPHIVNNNGR